MNSGVQILPYPQFKCPIFRTGDRAVTICFNSIGISFDTRVLTIDMTTHIIWFNLQSTGKEML